MSNSGMVRGWDDLLEGLRGLPERVLARVPEAERGDPQVQQEVCRVALSALAEGLLNALTTDPDHPVFVPMMNNFITTRQPNADTIYRSAAIAPGGTYRLRGRRGSANQASIAEMGPVPKQADGTPDLGGPRPTHDINALSIDAEGRYDVVLSTVRPSGHTGDWWQLDPTSTGLLARMVSSDWVNEVDPTISIERLDVPAPRPRPSAQTLEANLGSIAATANFVAPLFVDRPEKHRLEKGVNKLGNVDFSHLGGLSDQFYFEGAYEINDDEALIIEAPIPENCTYRSILLVNGIYEALDWYNNHTSLNGDQAPADKDGVLRVVVAGRDPGVANWLDTSGYPRGVIQGRWKGCASHSIPTVRKVPLEDVRKFLPKDVATITPQERDQRIRDRRAALQQRPLW